jgi:hypothetical protein
MYGITVSTNFCFNFDFGGATPSFHAILIIEKQQSHPLASNDNENSIPIKLKKRATQTEYTRKTGYAEDVLVTLLIGKRLC